MPFSFFNVVSVDPPVLAFAPLINGQREAKDTVRNLEEVAECVVHIGGEALIEALNTISVRLLRDDSRTPLEPLQATLALSLPAAGIEPITRRLEPVAPGRFRYIGPVLSLPGRWTLHIETLINDFEKAAFDAQVPIQ